MQRIKPMSPEGNDQLAATYKRITETRGYVSAILMSLSHAPAGLEAFARYGEHVRYATQLPGRVRELSCWPSQSATSMPGAIIIHPPSRRA